MLVLFRIRCRTQIDMSVALGDAGIMTCSDIVTAVLIRHAHQFAPFDMTVAQHAWIRRAACHIFVNEILYDTAPEGIAEIDDMVFKAHLLGIMLRLHDRLHGATAFLFGKAGVFDAVKGAEGDTHHFIALLQKKHGADGRVDAARHSKKHTLRYL